jgi:anti-sigma regulatory factor (Ser/Thr protein kinase)
LGAHHGPVTVGGTTMSYSPAIPLTCSVARANGAADALAHQALFYRGDDDYVEGVLSFIRPGVQAGEPVALALPPPRAAVLRQHLESLSPDIELLDMFELGRNPARIIPAVQEMLTRHGGRRLHYVVEPIWPGRSPAEIREATRHEALINLAWPAGVIRVLCPYDAGALDGSVLADAQHTHPWVIKQGEGSLSPDFTGATVPSPSDQPLSPRPAHASELRFGLHDLGRVRALVAARADAAGLSEARRADLVLAVNEAATNSIKHAEAPGLIRVWTLPAVLICQLEDPGHIVDPLAGRHHPTPSIEGGLGLWLVNQLCDLVEVRTSPAGTTMRLHMSRS